VRHNQVLQAMRGIAALVVVYGHAAGLRPPQLNAAFRYELVFQAKTAVVFFFVLSGFVLGSSVRRLRGESLWFGRYVVIRIARLVPIFCTSTLLGAAVAVISLRHPITDMGPWYYAVTSSQAPTLAQVFDTLLTQQISFNGVLWSIRVEYWMIPLLPLMVLVSDRASSLIDIIIIALGCALAACVVNKSLYEPSDLWAVPCWAYCFYLGVALNKIIQSLGRFGELLFSGGSALIAFVLMIVLLHYLRGGLWGAKLIIDGLLSTVLVGWAHKNHDSIGARLLQWRPLVLLGDMSYSVYAYGVSLLIPVTIATVSVLPHGLRASPHGGAFITLFCPTLSLALLLPLSWISFTWVELPAVKFGRWLAFDAIRQRSKRAAIGWPNTAANPVVEGN